MVCVSRPDGIFGIDLGATYSTVSYMDETGHAAVTLSSVGEDTTPSVVLFESEDHVLVGREAKESAVLYPDQVVSLIKREMGSREYRREFFGKQYTPPSISALILSALARDAEAYTGRKVTDVVITVPAYFGIAEREATQQACTIADLNVIAILAEPIAAALHYGATESADGATFLVYDLGGSTFNVSLIKMTETSAEILATDGNHHLGGSDWDAKLFEHILDQMVAQWNDDSARDDAAALQDILTLTEQIKKALSKTESRKVIQRYGGVTAKVTVTREQFEAMTAELLEETIHIVSRMLDAAETRHPGIREQITQLLLVGGSCRMPAVSERLKIEFGWDLRLEDPDLAVAKGAALYRPRVRIESAGPYNVIEAAVLSSALVPFVQALAAKTADDVYVTLRRLLPRMRHRGRHTAQDAASSTLVADAYARLVLQLPSSLDDGMQESLHLLLESLTRSPAGPRIRWIQISPATDKTSSWNVSLIDDVPAGCIVLEGSNAMSQHNSENLQPGDQPRDRQVGVTCPSAAMTT